MKSFKRLLMAGCMSAMLLSGLTGCGKEETKVQETEAAETPNPGTAEILSPETAENKSGDPAASEVQKGDTVQAAEPDPETEDAESRSESVETEFICGTVAEIGEDSFTFNRRMINIDEIIDLENMETELITVKCTDDTKYEHWTIRGGGADIDMEKAAFSDITKDADMEIQGYYEKGEFVAVRVVLEVYQ